MKLHNTLITTFLILPSLVFAQEPVIPAASDSPKKEKRFQKPLFSSKAFNYIFNKSFSKFATGQENSTPISNYASFDPANSRFLLNGFVNFRDSTHSKPTFLSFKISGNLIDGNATTLFSDKKLNTDVSIDLKYHFLFRKKQTTYFKDERLKSEDRKKDVLNDSARQKERFNLANSDGWISRQKQSVSWQIESVKYDYEILNRTSDEVFNKIISFRNANPRQNDSIKYYSDSSSGLIKKIAEKSNSRIELQAQYDSLNELSIRKDRLEESFIYNLKNTTSAKLLAAELESKINSIKYNWVTVILAFNKRKYYTFYDTLIFKDQLKKNTLDAFNMGIEWNYLHQGMLENKSHYFNIGLLKRRFNNLDELTTTDVVQERGLASNDTTRTISKKYSAFTDLVEDFRSWLFYSNYYFFFGKGYKTGFHLFPEYEFRSNQSDRINIGMGFVLAFKDEKKEKNILNVETYAKFLDVSDQQKTKDKFYERFELGIRVGLPFKAF